MRYVVTSAGKPDYYELRTSVGETVKVDFDFSPWLEDRGTNNNTVWSLVTGGLSFTEDGTTANLTFTSAGRSIITCSVTSSSGETKKVWLVVKAEDFSYEET